MARGVRHPASHVMTSNQTDERCPITELLVDQCAHCRPALPADPFDTPAPQRGSWFAAQYPGECSECGDPFDEGDIIRADGEGGYEMRYCSGCDR